MKGGQTVYEDENARQANTGKRKFQIKSAPTRRVHENPRLKISRSLRCQRLDELARRRAEDLALAVNDADGAREDAFGEVQRDELFIADLVGDGGFGQDRNADADLDRALDRLDVVELHHAIDLDLVLFEYAVNGLPRRDVSLEGDEIFSD